MKARMIDSQSREFDLKIVDIDAITEEEKQSLSEDDWRVRFLLKGRFDDHYCVGAVITFSDSDIPVGTEFELLDEDFSWWSVLAENKAWHITRISLEDYVKDRAKLKVLIRKWAVSNGIKFGE